MLTRFTIYWADGSLQGEIIDWPESPTLDQIRRLVEPIVGEPMEHVRVLDPKSDEYRDMFVDELGHMRQGGPRPRNEAATAIYRHNWLQHEGGEPDDLPWIAGTAIVFDRIIWT
jgi:hypothetical protein